MLEINDIRPNLPEKQPQSEPQFGEGVLRNNSLGSVDFVGFHRGPVSRSQRATVVWSLLASVIDVLFSFVLAAVFIFTFSVVTGFKFSMITQYLSSVSAEEFFAMSIVVLSFFYFVTLRAFLGFSIGEWTCDLRMGTIEQRFERVYILKVILRCTLVVATGLVTFPILSSILGRDVLGQITGLKLTSIK